MTVDELAKLLKLHRGGLTVCLHSESGPVKITRVTEVILSEYRAVMLHTEYPVDKVEKR